MESITLTGGHTVGKSFVGYEYKVEVTSEDPEKALTLFREYSQKVQAALEEKKKQLEA